MSRERKLAGSMAPGEPSTHAAVCRYRSLSGERLDRVPAPAGAPLVSCRKNALLGWNLAAWPLVGREALGLQREWELRPRGCRERRRGAGLSSRKAGQPWMCLQIDAAFPRCPTQGQDRRTGTEPRSSLERLNRMAHHPARRVPDLGQWWDTQEFQLHSRACILEQRRHFPLRFQGFHLWLHASKGF